MCYNGGGMRKTIKRERERLELSQRQLAALVGVGKTTIGEIERGERLPNVVTAIRIAKALHTTVEEYGARTIMDNRQMWMEQILRLLELATEEQLRVLYTAALYIV